MGLEPNWYQIGNKTCYIPKLAILCRKKISMLKDHLWHLWHVYFTDQKGIERWDPQGTEFEGLETQKWNIHTDRAQRVDEKDGVICLVMFAPGVTVIKMSKMAHFLYFLMMPA